MNPKKSEMTWGVASLWLCGMISFGCIGPFPDGPDESQGGDSATEPTSGSSTTEVSVTVTENNGTAGEGTSVPMPDSSGTVTSLSGTATCGDCGTDDTNDSHDTAGTSVCDIGVEHDPYWNTTYICACEACEVEFNNIAPSTGEALLEACECICDQVGCGGSITGGATTEEPGGEESVSDSTDSWGTSDEGPSDDDGPTDSGGFDSVSTSG